MSDFNWDDYENDGDAFGRPDDDDNNDERLNLIRKTHRLMFIDDLEKHQYQAIPLDPVEFADMFGQPTQEDMEIITQVFVKDYLHWEGKSDETMLYEKWGGDWIMELLKFNEDREEYELCSIMLESYKKCMKWIKKVYRKEIN
tara:strand:- start:152 stop:580 length:429 start_codon:yes stop_codon:yes gene_type:complete